MADPAERVGRPSPSAKERLKSGGWLWDPSIVEQLRREVGGKKVIVFDFDGTIARNVEGKYVVDDEAVKALDYAKKEGFFVVMWTTGSDKRFGSGDSYPVLNDCDLVINRENYQLRDDNGRLVSNNQFRDGGVDELKTWDEAVDRIGGITDETRKEIRKTGNGKHPEVLFPEVLLIEDSFISAHRRILKKESGLLYKLDEGELKFRFFWVGNLGQADANDRYLTTDRLKEILVKIGWTPTP